MHAPPQAGTHCQSETDRHGHAPPQALSDMGMLTPRHWERGPSLSSTDLFVPSPPKHCQTRGGMLLASAQELSSPKSSGRGPARQRRLYLDA